MFVRTFVRACVQVSYAIFSAASGLSVLGWVFYFAKVTVSSGRVLRGQPFMATRRQQLSYRVIMMQAFFVAVLVALAIAMEVVPLARHLLRQQTVPGAASEFTKVLFWFDLFCTGTGLLRLLSCVLSCLVLFSCSCVLFSLTLFCFVS